MATFQPFVEFTSSIGTLIVIYLRRAAGTAGHAAGRRPGRLLPVPGDVLRPGPQPERRLGSGPGAPWRARTGWPICWRKAEEPQNVPGHGPSTRPGRGRDLLSRMSALNTHPDVPVLEKISLDIPARSVVALVGTDRRGQVHAGQPDPPLLRCDLGAGSCSMGATCTSTRSTACASRSASCCRMCSCSTARCARTSCSADPNASEAEMMPGSQSRQRPRLHPEPAGRLRHARSASAASSSPAGRSSACRLPAPCSRMPPS